MGRLIWIHRNIQGGVTHWACVDIVFPVAGNLERLCGGTFWCLRDLHTILLCEGNYSLSTGCWSPSALPRCSTWSWNGYILPPHHRADVPHPQFPCQRKAAEFQDSDTVKLRDQFHHRHNNGR